MPRERDPSRGTLDSVPYKPPIRRGRHRSTNMSQVDPRVLAAFAAVYILWGSTYLAVSLALHSIPPFLLMGSRSLVGGLILFAQAKRRGSGSFSRLANRKRLRSAVFRRLPWRVGFCTAARPLGGGSDHSGDDPILDRDHWLHLAGRPAHPLENLGAACARSCRSHNDCWAPVFLGRWEPYCPSAAIPSACQLSRFPEWLSLLEALHSLASARSQASSAGSG